MKNICPKCNTKNSLFARSREAINCSSCAEHIRPLEKDEKLIEQHECCECFADLTDGGPHEDSCITL